MFNYIYTEFNDMNANKKDMVAFASIIDPVLCEGVVVKLVSVKSTEQVRKKCW